MPSFWLAVFTTLVCAILLVAYRLRQILGQRRPKIQRRNRNETPTHLLIVLGSGGHTAEMIAMLERAVNEKDETCRLNWQTYNYRTWVVGIGDTISAERARDFEEKIAHGKSTTLNNYRIITVPRARKIHQSLFTTPVSALRCMIACFEALLPPRNHAHVDFPDLILANGPATATILIFTAILLRFVDFCGCQSEDKMRTIYIESWARVKRLSLSGKLLERVVDRFLVQWPQLAEGSRSREFRGVLV